MPIFDATPLPGRSTWDYHGNPTLFDLVTHLPSRIYAVDYPPWPGAAPPVAAPRPFSSTAGRNPPTHPQETCPCAFLA